MRMQGWITCIGAALLATAGNLHAQEKVDWYLGAGIGDSTYDTGVNSISGTASLDEDDRTAKIFAGASFSPNLAIELQYSDLGEATLSGNDGDRFNINDSAFVFTSDNAHITAEGESIGISVVGSLPINERFNAFGRIGLHSWEVNGAVTAPDQRAELEDDGTDIFLGIGMEIALLEQVGLRIEAERYELDDEDVSSIGGSLIYRF